MRCLAVRCLTFSPRAVVLGSASWQDATSGLTLPQAFHLQASLILSLPLPAARPLHARGHAPRLTQPSHAAHDRLPSPHPGPCATLGATGENPRHSHAVLTGSYSSDPPGGQVRLSVGHPRHAAFHDTPVPPSSRTTLRARARPGGRPHCCRSPFRPGPAPFSRRVWTPPPLPTLKQSGVRRQGHEASSAMAEGMQGTAAATQEQRPPPAQPPNLRDPAAAAPAAGAAAQHLQNGSTHARHHQQQHREAARPQPGRSVQQEPWRPAPTRLLPLSFKEGRVRVDENGPAVLEDMSQQASLSCTTAAGVLVLGLAAKDGPTSLEDIALGKVSFCLCLTSLPIQVGGRVQECYATALARATWWRCAAAACSAAGAAPDNSVGLSRAARGGHDPARLPALPSAAAAALPALAVLRPEQAVLDDARVGHQHPGAAAGDAGAAASAWGGTTKGGGCLRFGWMARLAASTLHRLVACRDWWLHILHLLAHAAQSDGDRAEHPPAGLVVRA